MTLYLHSSITPSTIAEAAAAGIIGVKAYPRGVTTSSEAGLLDFQEYYPIFQAMQEHDLVLNLHGEVPSTTSTSFAADDADVVTVLNAEAMFLPTLHKLHAAFPVSPSDRPLLQSFHMLTRTQPTGVAHCFGALQHTRSVGRRARLWTNCRRNAQRTSPMDDGR